MSRPNSREIGLAVALAASGVVSGIAANRAGEAVDIAEETQQVETVFSPEEKDDYRLVSRIAQVIKDETFRYDGMYSGGRDDTKEFLEVIHLDEMLRIVGEYKWGQVAHHKEKEVAARLIIKEIGDGF